MDTLLFNGNVLTMESVARASAVAFRGGRIVAVGDTKALLAEAGGQTALYDLKGRTVVPGFIDAHAHIWKIGHLLTTMLDLRRAHSVEHLCAMVRQRDHEMAPGKWLQGRGFNEATLAEQRRPTRDDLDTAVPGRPVVLTRTCGHIFVANSAALKLAGITAQTPAPVGGVIERNETGEPNGTLHETAMGLITRVMPPPTASEYEQMIWAALNHQLSLGITSSSDCGVSPELLNVYLELDRKGAFPARILVMPLRRVDGRQDPVPLPRKHVSDRLRVDTIKFLADGGLSGATAALSIPYRHGNSKGTLRFDEEDLRVLCQESHDEGWRIATHAIGDVAIDQVLGIYEGLGPHPEGLAHRIEHFGLPSEAHLKRAAKMGVISVPQSIFIKELGRNFLESVPDQLLARTYPIRAMLDDGLTVALSSDAPVVEDDNPLAGMSAAITRRTMDGVAIAPEQAISAEEALYAYTMGGAIASGEAANRGSIRPGKWADVAVLSADPVSTDPAALPEIAVEMTFIAGSKVYLR
ncbi:MAG: amidohydrolase [Bryobacteraceae bacterium]|jgi:predicted amidohydrolase YtcJ